MKKLKATKALIGKFFNKFFQKFFTDESYVSSSALILSPDCTRYKCYCYCYCRLSDNYLKAGSCENVQQIYRKGKPLIPANEPAVKKEKLKRGEPVLRDLAAYNINLNGRFSFVVVYDSEGKKLLDLLSEVKKSLTKKKNRHEKQEPTDEKGPAAGWTIRDVEEGVQKLITASCDPSKNTKIQKH